jgi:hypothetical protein
MIYIIGDSHVSVFSGTDKTYNGLRHIQPEFGTCYTLSQGKLRANINRFEQKIPFFCPIKIGSYTAYNSFDKMNKIEQVILEYNIKKEDYIFLCFGEIDIRNHIGFQSEKQNISLKKSIEICVDKYMNTIMYLKGKNYNVSVYSPPASSIGWAENIKNDYKNVKVRNLMTLYFNKYLKLKCSEHGILVLGIAEKMILQDGTTEPSFIMDDIHLSQKTMPLILEEFKEIICKVTNNP